MDFAASLRASVPAAAAAAGLIAVPAGAAVAFLGPLVLLLPLGLGATVLAMRYPLVVYCAFLFVGVFKPQASVLNLPVDITVLAAALVVLACLYRAFQGRAAAVPPLLSLLIGAIGLAMVVSLAWAPDVAYAEDKTIRFLTLTLLAAIAPAFLIEHPRDSYVLVGTMVAIAALGAGLMLASGGETTTGRLALGASDDTIFVGRLLAAAALVLLFLPSDVIWARTVAAIAGGGFLLVGLAVGSRGPLVAFALAALVIGVGQLAISARRTVPLILGLVTVVVGITSFTLPQVAEERIASLSQGPANLLGSEHRGSFYETAIDLTQQYPVRGIGVGGFATMGYSTTQIETIYPHNIFLELSAELGLVPPFLLAAGLLFLGARWVKYLRTGASPQHAMAMHLVVGLLVYWTVAAQFSSDINGNRGFWGFLGVTWLLLARPTVRAAPHPYHGDPGRS